MFSFFTGSCCSKLISSSNIGNIKVYFLNFLFEGHFATKKNVCGIVSKQYGSRQITNKLTEVLKTFIVFGNIFKRFLKAY